MINKQKEFLGWIVYQIYPRSFKDSNNDGIGDIKGIIQKLDYLKELGVNAVWLSPCYKSPNEDNGYDISDYCDIMDEFGTLDDWKEMIEGMHKRGIKLIMDFVANHTSSEHKWFIESRKSKDNPYRDYYVWADKPLTDWKSVFGGSAWEYDANTEQYYLHSFAKGQPDLNWENPKVREEMCAVVDFWVDLGVDGFRCDVLDAISKDFENNLDSNGPHLHEYIKELFGREKTKNIFTVGECWGANPENVKLLISPERNELSTVFQFDHIMVGRGDKDKFIEIPFKLYEVRDQLIKWQTIMDKNDLLYTLFFENHDMPRCTSRWGDDGIYRYESATMLATMSFLHKGIPFIYQGQEIGITNSGSRDINDFRDLETINYYNENYRGLSEDELMDSINYSSRDHARRPFPWDESIHAGFSDVDAWQPDYKRYKEINFETDRKSDRSVYQYYKALIELKKNNVFTLGEYKNLSYDNKMYIYERTFKGEKYVVICNFEDNSELNVTIFGDIILSNTDRKEINGVYRPYECAVVKVK